MENVLAIVQKKSVVIMGFVDLVVPVIKIVQADGTAVMVYATHIMYKIVLLVDQEH
jgi:hypothetical protein